MSRRSGFVHCVGRRRGNKRPSDRKRAGFSTGIRTRVFRFGIAVAVYLFGLAGWDTEALHAGQPDFAPYARAVEFCRGIAKRPMALDLDKRVLCFDGIVRSSTVDLELAGKLSPNGLFVVRSYGGELPTAIELADLLRDRHATVVAYDYCFSACASFLLIASDEAFVMRNTLVAWHHTTMPLCPSLEVPKDGGPLRLEKLACPDSSASEQDALEWALGLEKAFYATRVVDPLFEEPPESFTMRKILRAMFERTGTYPDVSWTWNPRYYASALKTKITYEAYPNSQEEVDALASKLGVNRIIYDP
jgi:hypothetical protein